MAPILEATEHDFDTVALFVSALVVSDVHGSAFPDRNAVLDALLLKRIAEPIGVIAPVCLYSPRLGQTEEQDGCGCIVADIAGNDK